MKKSIMSYGGGVQSTTLAILVLNNPEKLMEVMGCIPNAYFFADTGDERKVTYEHVHAQSILFREKGFYFERVRRSAESLIEHLLLNMKMKKSGTNTLPFFVASKTGKGAPLMRNCTSAFKVAPLDKAIKKYLGIKKSRKGQKRGGFLDGPPIQHWLGISYDEVQRTRIAQESWRDFCYPLVEMRWTRGHCLEYLREQKVTIPPRSSCVYCPFHGTDEWKNIKEDPEAWEKAVLLDEALERACKENDTVFGVREELFLTKTLVRLRDLDLEQRQMSLFGWECSGVCGI